MLSIRKKAQYMPLHYLNIEYYLNTAPYLLQMTVTILIDNDSWFTPYGYQLQNEIRNIGYVCDIVFKHKDVKKGSVLFLLGCVRMFHHLKLNTHNIVIHGSDLPQGKGWSPLSWQILEGKNSIPMTLFEATEELDAGKIYIKDSIELTGYELLNETQNMLGLKTIELAVKFMKNIDNIEGIEQAGISTFYPKRTPVDSELDINKSIKDQFDLLRICSNDRYPAFFHINNRKYILKIYNDV